jgi:hypothetical protein
MPLNQLPHDGEAEAAAIGIVAWARYPHEWLPDMGSLFGGDTRALIGHRYAGHAIASRQRDRHGLAGWSVLHGVVEQVEKDLSQRSESPGRLPLHRDRCGLEAVPGGAVARKEEECRAAGAQAAPVRAPG